MPQAIGCLLALAFEMTAIGGLERHHDDTRPDPQATAWGRACYGMTWYGGIYPQRKVQRTDCTQSQYQNQRANVQRRIVGFFSRGAALGLGGVGVGGICVGACMAVSFRELGEEEFGRYRGPGGGIFGEGKETSQRPLFGSKRRAGSAAMGPIRTSWPHSRSWWCITHSGRRTVSVSGSVPWRLGARDDENSQKSETK